MKPQEYIEKVLNEAEEIKLSREQIVDEIRKSIIKIFKPSEEGLAAMDADWNKRGAGMRDYGLLYGVSPENSQFPVVTHSFDEEDPIKDEWRKVEVDLKAKGIDVDVLAGSDFIWFYPDKNGNTAHFVKVKK